jgi:hypothetical protein
MNLRHPNTTNVKTRLILKQTIHVTTDNRFLYTKCNYRIRCLIILLPLGISTDSLGKIIQQLVVV